MNKHYTFQEYFEKFSSIQDSYDYYFEQQKEIDRLNNIISETSKDIQHELSHLKANDEISWNEEFYTNDKLDYRKLCIALLEQFVNKLKEKE